MDLLTLESNNEVVWEEECSCGQHLAIVVVGGSITINKLYRGVICGSCGKTHLTD